MTHPGWAVAIVEPGRDHVAEQKLRRAGFRVICLTRRRLLTGHNRPGWRRSGDFVSETIFAGYLLLQLWPDQELPDSAQIPEYLGLVHGGRVTLPAYVVHRWCLKVNRGDYDDQRKPQRAQAAAKFQPATTAEQRATLLRAHFDKLIGAQDRVYA